VLGAKLLLPWNLREIGFVIVSVPKRGRRKEKITFK
jgi:hypothetical protein